MKALTYQSSKNVSVETVPDPVLQQDDDIVLRVTATAICGSDLHIYRGKIPDMESGDILGHEFMGIVEETGKGVTRVKKGDRVVVPFTIACGQCFFCAKALFAACETTNPGRGAILNKKNLRSGAGLFGYSHLYGGYPGGQAEYVRVPKANTGPLVIPPGLADEQVLFLSDILPTGYQAVVNGDVGPGSSVAIFGAGPVGLMAAASARLLGAERIFMVDEHPTGSRSRRPPTASIRSTSGTSTTPRARSSSAPISAASMRRSTRSASRPRAARSRRCSPT
jgi:threonine dehydrogenase-like Zn-dependent dehydrogenase